MPRRHYHKTRRAELEAETRERILRATAALHAEHGTFGTSWAMIAQKAGVSPQTVYNHFPDLPQLIGGCTAHVLAQAPPVDAACFADATGAAARLRALAKAVFAQLEFLAPWLRLGWGDAELLPALRAVLDQGRQEVRRLVALAVAPRLRATPEFLDAALVLLDYPARGRASRARAAAPGLPRWRAIASRRCFRSARPTRR
jgi:AcrR family transcriptional regulator